MSRDRATLIAARAKKRRLLDSMLGDVDPAPRPSTSEAIQRALAADAQERMALEAAATRAAGDRDNAVVVTIAVPPPYSHRWPDPVVHNHGHEPHLTVLFVSANLNHAEASEALHMVRRAARTIPPFRVFVDAQGGLQDFGPNEEKGEKALWLSARAEPRGELGRLHRTLKLGLEREGIKTEGFSDFTPHVTWAYVPNDFADEDRRVLDAHVSDRFDRGFWFDVRHLMMSMPDGRVKVIALSPIPRTSVY